MRILFTTHQGNLAGSTYSVFYLARGLAERGHQVHLACSQDRLLWSLFQEIPGARCHEIRFASYWDLSSIFRLIRVVKSNHIEVINAQGGKDRNLVILARWISGFSSKVVFTRRQRPRDEPFIKRWLHLKGSDAIVMISHGLKYQFVAKGYPESRLTVIHNGIPTESFQNLLQSSIQDELKNRLGKPEKIIGCVSRMKRQDLLIKALKYLPESYAVLFVGIHIDELDSVIAEETPKQRLIFVGPQEHSRAVNYYPLMDMMVLPTHMDGFGMVLLEAMICKVPVIASDFGGVKDIVEHEENGLLFNNDDAKAMAAQITKIEKDGALRDKLVINGLATVHRFSIDRTVLGYEDFFERLTAKTLL